MFSQIQVVCKAGFAEVWFYREVEGALPNTKWSVIEADFAEVWFYREVERVFSQIQVVCKAGFAVTVLCFVLQ